MLDIKLVGTKELAKKFEALAKKMPGKLKQTMDRAIKAVRVNVVRKKLSGRVLKVQTGRLRNSITAKVEKSGADVVGKVGTNVKYGKAWEDTGIKVHTITPKSKKALHFFYKGKEIFCKSANLPAQKPRPFLAPALQEEMPKIMAMFRRVIA